MKPGTYSFSYISVLGLLKNASLHNWEIPKPFDVPNAVRFEVVNDSVIYKLDRSFKRVGIARRISPSNSDMFKTIPKRYLDFELVGVYNYDHLPKDVWQAYYYSKKRKSLMGISHIFEANRIYDAVVFMDKPNNPFSDYTKFFKVLTGRDTAYYYPTIKTKQIIIKQN